MKNLIRNLIDTAPEIDNPIVKQLKADVPDNATRRYLECQVVLKGGYSMAGILTYANETSTSYAHLHLAAIAQTPDKKVLLADHYFTYDDVATIVVARPLDEPLVRPINPTRNGSPIIIG